MKKILIAFLFMIVSTSVFGSSDFGLKKVADGPTISVAAYNATKAEKANAKYKCDGTADDVEWRLAISDISSAGTGHLLASSGRFNFAQSVTLTTLAYGQYVIEGQGMATTTIYMANGSNCDAFVTSITSGASTFIEIKKIMINGNRANNPGGGFGYYDGYGTGQAGDTLIEQVFFYNMKSDCAKFKSCWNTQILKCIFEDSSSAGINLVTGTHATIENCKFIHMLGNNIQTGCPGSRVNNNFILHAGSGVGINILSGANYSRVSGNDIHSDTEFGGNTGIASASGYGVFSNNIVQCASNTYIAYAIAFTAASSNNRGEGNIVNILGTPIYDASSTNFVSVNGSKKRILVSKTDSYQMTAPNDIPGEIIMGNKGSAFSVSLPAQPAVGDEYTILNVGAGIMTLGVGGAGHLINGAATQAINSLRGFNAEYVGSNNWILYDKH